MLALLCTTLGACGSYKLDDSAQEGEYQAVPSEPIEEAGEFALQINAEMELDLQTGRLNALIGNPRGNSRNCLVTLLLDETGETLYKSGVLFPGGREVYIQIETDPFAGKESCPATAIFTILDEKTGEEIGQVEAGVVIYPALRGQEP